MGLAAPAFAGEGALRWAIALSVAVHAVVGLTAASGGFGTDSEPRPAHAPLTVRWASPMPVPASPPADAVEAPPGPSGDPGLSSAVSAHSDAPAPVSRLQPEPARPESPGPATPAASPEPIVTAAAAAAPAPLTADVDGYLPRKLLTTPPRPLAEITMHWPPGMLPLGRRVGHFTLFIDEAGTVRKMVPDDRSLPPPLEEAAREVFAAAAFAPGELDGRPMKSIIRIEVVFESTASAAGAAPAAAPVVVSRQNL